DRVPIECVVRGAHTRNQPAVADSVSDDHTPGPVDRQAAREIEQGLDSGAAVAGVPLVPPARDGVQMACEHVLAIVGAAAGRDHPHPAPAIYTGLVPRDGAIGEENVALPVRSDAAHRADQRLQRWEAVTSLAT